MRFLFILLAVTVTSLSVHAAKENSKKPTAKVNVHGFIEDNLKEAIARATKEKKLILADFSARWCPGCVRLETETFDTLEFHKSARNFVKVRIDFDRFENSTAKKTYEVHSIPAMIVLSPDGQEISRLVDYQPMQTIATFLDSVAANPVSFEELKHRAANDATATKLLGERLYASERYGQSVDYLAKVSPTPIELANARVQAARQEFNKDPNLKNAYILALKSAVQNEPTTTRSVEWRTALLETLDKDDPTRKAIYDSGVSLCDSLLADPEKLKVALVGDLVGEFTGYESMMLAADRAELISAYTDNPELTLKAWQVVADIGKKANIPKESVGPRMRYLIFLTAAHRYEEGEVLAQSLLSSDPKNPEIQRRLLKIYNEEKKYDAAIALGKICLPKSYGMNEIWTAEQIAKAYIGAGKKQDAKSLLQLFLSRTDLAWSSMEREHKSFETLRASLN
jgi:thioredoxin-related protein